VYEQKRLILAYHGSFRRVKPCWGEGALRPGERFHQASRYSRSCCGCCAARANRRSGCRPSTRRNHDDDAYRGAVTVACASSPHGLFPLQSRGTRATDNHVFWWDALSLGTAKLDEKLRNYALYRLGGADERIRAWAARAAIPSCDQLPTYAQTATQAELAVAVSFLASRWARTPGRTPTSRPSGSRRSSVRCAVHAIAARRIRRQSDRLARLPVRPRIHSGTGRRRRRLLCGCSLR